MKLTAILAVVLPAALSSALLCTPNANSPSIEDCKAALNALPKPPANGNPVPCLKVYAPRWELATKGKCRITGYSSRGGAACLDRKQVIEAATIVYENCQLNDAFVAGGAALSGNEEGVFEGVLLEVATD